MVCPFAKAGTTPITVNPGQQVTWSLNATFYATAKGPATSYNDLLALHTVAIGGVTLTDTSGNPLPLSDMSSSAGFDYAGAATGLGLLAVRRRS